MRKSSSPLGRQTGNNAELVKYKYLKSNPESQGIEGYNKLDRVVSGKTTQKAKEDEGHN